MRKTIYLVLVIAIILVSSCQTINKEDLQKKIREANSKLESYKMDATVTTTTYSTIDGEPFNMVMTMKTLGDVDRASKRMFIKAILKTNMASEQEDTITEAYFDEKNMYTYLDDVCVQLENEEDIWAEKDELEKTNTLLENAEITEIKDESADGKQYYVIFMKPDVNELGPLITGQDIDFSESIKKYTIEVWVNKENYITEKSIYDMKTEVATQTGEIVVTEIHSEITLADINEPMEIDIPQECLDGPTLQEILAAKAMMEELGENEFNAMLYLSDDTADEDTADEGMADENSNQEEMPDSNTE